MITLKQLIAIDTQNPGTDYKKMTLFLSRELKKQGAEVVMCGQNIVGMWGNPKLLINAHIDTVKAVGWKNNPLVAKVTKSKTIGLGTCDNKGNIYCIFNAIENIQEQREVKNLMVLFSVDEEFGKVSKIHEFLASKYAKGIKNVLVLEPTENKKITKHPGYYSFWLTFTAKEGHSSIGKENAIAKAARAITKLKGFNIGSIESKNISGNISAGQCKIKISIRTYEKHKTIIKKIKKIAKGALLESSFIGGPFINRGPFTKGANASVPFWSEAAIFAQNGYNTVLYGAGSILQAHAPDEYVSHQSLEKCTAFLKFVIGEHS